MTVARAGIIYAAANVASATVPFLLLPLLTRVLTPAEYGEVVSFALIVTLCMAVAGLSAHSAVGVSWFRLPDDEVPPYVGVALAIAAASSLAVMALVALLFGFVPAHGASLGPTWGALAAMTAGATVILQCRLVLWQSQQRPVQSALLQVVASVLNIAVSLFAVLVLGLGGEGRNAGIAVAAVLAAGLAVASLFASGDARWAPRGAHARQIVTYGLPLVPHVLAGAVLATADRWMVSLTLSRDALGVYGAGAQLGAIMSVFADAFVKAYAPWLYARLASTQAADKQVAVGAIYVTLPVFLLLAIPFGTVVYWASWLLFGERYHAATSVLPWFFLGGSFTGMYMATSVLYFFSGRTMLLASISAATAVVSVACSWVLVSTLGVDGAAISYAVTQGFLAVAAAAVAIRSFDLPWAQPTRAVEAWWRNATLGRAQA